MRSVFVNMRTGEDEAETHYIGENESDRFIVALIVGYDREALIQSMGDAAPRRPRVRTLALQAARATLDLTIDDASDDTFWSVYDRETKRMFTFEQGEFRDKEIR